MAASKFQKKQTKAVKSDGRYIFSDFSDGLYLLDTPRSINQQLASLALKGGRNVWAEYGALVPQYGYNIEAQLPKNEYVVGIEYLHNVQFFVNGFGQQPRLQF